MSYHKFFWSLEATTDKTYVLCQWFLNTGSHFGSTAADPPVKFQWIMIVSIPKLAQIFSQILQSDFFDLVNRNPKI